MGGGCGHVGSDVAEIVSVVDTGVRLGRVGTGCWLSARGSGSQGVEFSHPGIFALDSIQDQASVEAGQLQQTPPYRTE